MELSTLRNDRQAREHYRGRYIICMERKGNAFVYDVLTKSGQPVAAGLDMLSRDEETAVEGIVSRLYGKAQEKAA